jgi:hypothetical protein
MKIVINNNSYLFISPLFSMETSKCWKMIPGQKATNVITFITGYGSPAAVSKTETAFAGSSTTIRRQS